MKRILKLAVYGIAAIAALSSCSKNEDVPSQKDIETKIIGRWKSVAFDGVTQLTNGRAVMTYFSDKTATFSMSRFMDELGVYAWSNKIPQIWSVEGNTVYEKCIENSAAQFKKVVVIEDNNFSYVVTRVIEPQSGESTPNWTIDAQKVTADYSQDIIGMWEGVEMTGEETYGDANHRIEYKADGTYVYYDKDGDDWKLSEDVDNEYNVDGDWLASRWRPKAGEDFEYEWWDIVEIKDGTMKWSALREKEDGTRFTTTFTWKKIQ